MSRLQVSIYSKQCIGITGKINGNNLENEIAYYVFQGEKQQLQTVIDEVTHIHAEINHI